MAFDRFGRGRPLAMGLMVLTSTFASATPAASASAESVSQPAVAIVGDSLTVGSAAAMTAILREAGVSARVDAQVARHTSEGYAAPYSGIRALRALLEDSVPDLILAALGTNDVTTATTESSVRRDVGAFVAAARGVRVCWVELHRRGDGADAQAFERANGWYRAAIEQYGGCWLTWSPSTGEWAADGIHLTAAGYQRRGRQLGEQLVSAIAPSAAPMPTVADIGTPLGFAPMSPRRVFDSRDGTGRPMVQPQGDVEIPLDPGEFTAVVVGLTMTGPTADGWMSVWGCGPWPGTSTLNVSARRTRTNLAIVVIDPTSPRLCLRTSVATDAVVDVMGGLRGGGTPIAPATTRLFDSRPRQLDTGTSHRIEVPGPSVAAALVTLTALGGPSGYVSAGSCQEAPTVSNLNFDGADPVASTTLVPVVDGGFCVWNSARVGLLVDLVATVAPEGTSSIQLAAPTRIVDTRIGLGARGVGPGSPIRLAGVLANVTYPGGARAGYFGPSCGGATSVANWGDRTGAAAGFAVLQGCLTSSADTDVVIDQWARLVPVEPSGNTMGTHDVPAGGSE